MNGGSVPVCLPALSCPYQTENCVLYLVPSDSLSPGSLPSAGPPQGKCLHWASTVSCHFPIVALIHSFTDLFYCRSPSSCWRYSGEQKRLKESKGLALTELMFTRVK